MKAFVSLALILALAANAPIRSVSSLGKAEAQCRPNEPGPALLIVVHGLKDRDGILRAELYPANDQDFLADDNILVQQGKVAAVHGFKAADEEGGVVHGSPKF